MKKAYIIPTVEVVNLDATSMLATSPVREISFGSGNIDTSAGPDGNGDGGQLGRDDNDFNLWNQGW